MTEAPPAGAALPAALVLLGDDLRSAGYEETAVRERLQLESTLIAPAEATVARRRLGDDRLSRFIRLFLFRESVPAATVRGGEVELLERDADAIRSSVAVQPWRDVLVTHDWLGGAPAEDHVVGASGVTEALADLTVRRPVESVLDLFTGSGAQAVLASRHADRVVGVDLNPRALRLAEWTLALNRVDNVELRAGDVRDACSGERFDLVVANPPFVVSPDRRWLFRDAGAGISRAVVARLPGLLRRDGFATALCQWPLRRGERWDEQPRAWVGGSACDAWILRLPTLESPLEYAANWNRLLEWYDRPEFERTVDRWVAHFDREGVDRIVTGAIVLRRREGSSWLRVDEASGWPAEPVGEAIERLFEGQTAVAALEDEALLDLRLQPTGALRLDETRAYGERGFDLIAAQARGALPLRTKVNRPAVSVLACLDGATRLGDLPDAVQALHAIRELLATGLLVAGP
jgi:methylase of polypeptide subunit release factors